MKTPDKTTHPVFFSNEIAGVFLSERCGKDAELAQRVQQDAKATIFSTYNMDFGDVAVNTVRNTSSQVALVLPYYSGIQEASARSMSEYEIEHTAAGFEFVTLIVTIVSLTAATATASVASTSIGVGVHAATK